MVAVKDNRCEKCAIQESFNNLQDGSQDFTKIMISSPRIEASFINSGSGSQDLKGHKIPCDDKSILHNFNLFNYHHTGNNRHMTVSTPSVTTTTISLPNNPRRTPNHRPHFSGIVNSFNNSEEGIQDFSLATIKSTATGDSFNNSEGGLQDFSDAKIKSTATGDSFNNLGSGSQTFREAEIRCGEESSKPSRSTLPLKGDHLHSFNNKGSQCFDGFNRN
ncbi:hypothetical protein PHAVU_002G195300 [Phaseolus vulgaris]|uniref:Uncharacterized protein n=1 Tax=Phaseolus vulgaris TaxID=3885 RepID=V7CL74_PHAVU|nr:hypothetical protein PHAVU_002G195300g [Phaseolus vulgaris]ESW30942.1 hypothetical protein PHAVU_002G195300g [Phaseolus vulgaris]